MTFNWVLEHRQQENFFPEFAGRVVYLSDILVIAGLFVWLIGRLLARSERLRLGPWYVAAPLLTLFALSALSVLWAEDQSQAATAALRRVWLLGLYVAAVNGSGKALLPMVVALFGVGLLQAGVALSQVALGGPTGLTVLGEIPKGAHFYTQIGGPRAVGLGFSPNPPGMYLAVVSSLAFGVFLLLRGGFWVKALLGHDGDRLTCGPAGMHTGDGCADGAVVGVQRRFAQLGYEAWLGRGTAGGRRFRRGALPGARLCAC